MVCEDCHHGRDRADERERRRRTRDWTVTKRGRAWSPTLRSGGFLVSMKDYIVPLGKCDRCKTMVEPRISTQWFVKIQAAGQTARSMW